jgi:L-seryl-tRNA(Ser) seleniumtransferase
VLGRLSSEVREQLTPRIVENHAQVGGGALPTVQLPTAGVALGATPAAARALDAALRVGEPPVIGRMLDDRLYLDCRTVLATQVSALATAIGRAAARLATTEHGAASQGA